MTVHLTTTYVLPPGGWDLRTPIELNFNGLVIHIAAPPPETDPREQIGAIADVLSVLDDATVEAELGTLELAVEFAVLSLPLRKVSEHVVRTHHEAVTHAVQLLRWRLGAMGGHREIASTSGTTWRSDDGRTGRFPVSLSVEGSHYALVAPTPVQRTAIEQWLTIGVGEPLGHSLLREARQHVEANPRSALAIGVAALEIGVKNYIASEEPVTRWLVEESSSPPVVKILSHYISKLREHKTPGAKTPRLSSRIYRVLGAAVHARNKLVHAGAAPPDRSTLRSTLGVIQDVLYYLDFLSGETWAVERLTSETRTELGV